jgi:lipopolysaccharide biosynthesis regulator YciM
MKRISCGFVAFLLAVVLVGCATAQRGTMIQARAKLDEGGYKEALAKLADAEKMVAPTPELQAEILYLRAECYEGLGRKPEAVGAQVRRREIPGLELCLPGQGEAAEA